MPIGIESRCSFCRTHSQGRLSALTARSAIPPASGSYMHAASFREVSWPSLAGRRPAAMQRRERGADARYLTACVGFRPGDDRRATGFGGKRQRPSGCKLRQSELNQFQMRFLANDPSILGDLLIVRDAGDVIFLCGAGPKLPSDQRQEMSAPCAFPFHNGHSASGQTRPSARPRHPTSADYDMVSCRRHEVRTERVAKAGSERKSHS